MKIKKLIFILVIIFINQNINASVKSNHVKSFISKLNNYLADKAYNIKNWIYENPKKFIFGSLAIGTGSLLWWLKKEYDREQQQREIREREREIQKIIQNINIAIQNEENQELIKKYPNISFISRIKLIFEWIDEKIQKEIESNQLTQFFTNFTDNPDMNLFENRAKLINIIYWLRLLDKLNLEANKVLISKNIPQDEKQIIKQVKDNNLVIECTKNPFLYYIKYKKIKYFNLKNIVNKFNQKYLLKNYCDFTIKKDKDNYILGEDNYLISYFLEKDPTYYIFYCNLQQNNTEAVKQLDTSNAGHILTNINKCLQNNPLNIDKEDTLKKIKEKIENNYNTFIPSTWYKGRVASGLAATQEL